MARQIICLTEPNDEWLKSQVDTKEYNSKSEWVYDIIRQARKQQDHIEGIRKKMDLAEKSGFNNDSKEQILKESKARLDC